MTDKVGATKRIEYIDAMRGFTMFLVVFMHTAQWCLNSEAPIHGYLSLIRMPMFFLISGFVLYKAGVTWDAMHIVQFFKKKIPVQLIGPFLFFIVYLFSQNINILDGIFDGPKYGYWFTFVLFEYFVFYAMVRFFIRSSWASVVLVALGIMLYPCSWPPYSEYLHIPESVVGFFSFRHLHYFIFFVLGTLLKQHFDKFQQWLDGKYLLTCCIFVFFLGCAFIYPLPLPELFIRFPITLSGLVVVFSFFRKKQAFFSHETATGRLFQYVGRRTLDIYLIHYFLLPTNLSYITIFKDHPMQTIELLVSFVIAAAIIALCLLIGNILRLSPFIAHWFFGVKNPH